MKGSRRQRQEALDRSTVNQNLSDQLQIVSSYCLLYFAPDNHSYLGLNPASCRCLLLPFTPCLLPLPPASYAFGCDLSYTSINLSIETCVYCCVVERRAWPSNSWMARRSAPASRRWVAKEWRRECGLM